MNKTVNINLGGLLFHIDEEAFNQLNDYLNSLKKSFANELGADEIIADIEARIAEIFNDAKENELHVINLKNVEEAIAIMGTPEELNDSEEQPAQESANETYEEAKQKKQLYRDMEQAYISGVAAGISHYFGIDVFWVRLALILSVIFTGGSVILVYLSFWFFVPEAVTTADKLAMKGHSVNVNNIEKKIKEGFNNVADNVKTAYNNTNTDEIKNKSVVVFNRLGHVLGKILKIFGAFIGILLMLASGAGIIALFTGFIGTSLGFFGSEWFHYNPGSFFGVNSWLTSLLIFLISSIPLTFLFFLGLRISFGKVRKFGKPILLSLLGVWILAIIGISITKFINNKKKAFSASAIIENTLPISSTDTLKITMQKQDRFVEDFDFESDFKIREDENGEKVLVYQDLKIYIKTTDDETAFIEVKKQAKGPSYNEALEIAETVKYNYTLENNTLLLDAYGLGNYEYKWSDSKIKVILNLPEGTTILADNSTRSYNNRRNSDEYAILRKKENHYVTLLNGNAVCKTCPNKGKYSNESNIDIDIDWHDLHDEKFEEELEAKIESFIEENVDTDSGEVDFNGKDFNIKINEDGIEIKSEKKE